MSERVEELPVEVLQADEVLARVYRMGEIFQAFLFILLAFFGSLGLAKLAYGKLETPLLIEVILFYVAIIFPIVVKAQSTRRYAFGLGLRLSTIGGIVFILASEYGIQGLQNRGLLIATTTILVFELYQHLIGIYPKKRAYLAIIVAVAAMLFFASILAALAYIVSVPIAAIGSLILTLLFVRAILPESKIRDF